MSDAAPDEPQPAAAVFLTDAVEDPTAALIATLIEHGLSIVAAESLTGGALTAELIRIPGASEVVRGGIVAYATELKASLLGVNAALLAEHGPVHADVAIAMARGARTAATLDGRPADLGVATTGVAGPDAQGDAPVGLVYVAVADARGARVRELRLEGTRAAIRHRAVEEAIALVREHLSSRE